MEARPRTRKAALVVVAVIAALAVSVTVVAETAKAGSLPAGFQETTAFSGLENPTVVRFAPDGRVFVAEKSGLIKTFDGMTDTTPTVFADLRTEVHNYWDRGLLGMALDHYFTDYPWVYVSYTRDATIGGAAPRWGTAGATSDPCPSPPGPTTDGCVVSGRVSRLVSSGDVMQREDPLVDDWCQQFPSHSIGSLEQDQWGWLYVGGGDGANFDTVDFGQFGDPENPCGDPPAGVGGSQDPPDAEGGALRSQDLRTSGDPVGLDGTIARIDPTDGSGLDVNPLHASTDPNARRIIATGFRNPFRFAISRDDEVWVGDVGWLDWEEINSFPAYGADGDVPNFGWPCYEGGSRQPSYGGADFTICNGLFNAGDPVTTPAFAYEHTGEVVPGETCPSGSSSISGLRFYDGSSFPASYRDALFFTDYSRNCIWVMRAGANGKPDPSTVANFATDAAGPVFLEVGPDGALYYVDIAGGRIQRIQYTAGNQPPIADATASPTNGAAPLTVQFDGTGSGDPDDGDSVTYAWDLDADGEYDDSTALRPSYTYTQDGSYDASLEVTDSHGASGQAAVTIDVGNTPPVPTITGPTSALKWSVGEEVSFAGTASDPQDGPLSAEALDWELIMHHCPSNCHSHTIQSWDDVASGSFAAPDHEYPSHLELRLTATDSKGMRASTSVSLDPKTVDLTLASDPAGLTLINNATTGVAPFTTRVIEGSHNTISAASPQDLGGTLYTFGAWSDGGDRTHSVVANSSATYTAVFQGPSTSNPVEPSDDEDPDSQAEEIDVPGTDPEPEERPHLSVHRLRVPQRPAELVRRGARARVRCDRECEVGLKVVAKGSAARRMGIAGVIARGWTVLAAGDREGIKAFIRGGARGKLSGAAREREHLRFVARLQARAAG